MRVTRHYYAGSDVIEHLFQSGVCPDYDGDSGGWTGTCKIPNSDRIGTHYEIFSNNANVRSVSVLLGLRSCGSAA